jgi:flagellar protein FlaJ
MRHISKRKRITAAIVPIAFLTIIVLTLAITNFNALTTYANELFFLGLLIVLVPSAVLDIENQRWISALEDQMPMLVRGISESQETGLTLVRALEKVVDNKLVGHPLSDEIKRVTIQMSWGASFEQALTNFKERINSPIVNRFCALVLEASRSGGTIKKVFTATSGFMEEMKDIDRETSAQMKPYIIVIYSAFVIFVVTAVLLVQAFFAPMQGAPQIMSGISIGNVGGLKVFFYQDMLISAISGGLMAGKLGERRAMGGLKHSIILGVIGYVIFFFAIPPSWM